MRRVIESLTMGSSLSHPPSSREAPPRQEIPLSDDEEDGPPRPAKRRRISHSDDNVSSMLLDQTPKRSPSDYARSNSNGVTAASSSTRHRGLEALLSKRTQQSDVDESQNFVSQGVSPTFAQSLDETIFQHPVIDFHRALRVDINGIIGKSSKDLDTQSSAPPLKSPINLRVRCSLVLSYLNKDADDSSAVSDYTQLYRTSKIGTVLATLPHGAAAEADILLPEPFIIQADELYVNRKVKSSKPNTPKRRDAQYVFGLADKYKIDIWMEPVGYQKDWPPVAPDPKRRDSHESIEISKALETGKANPHDLRLFSSTSAVLDPDRQARPLDLKLSYENSKLRSLCALKVDIMWSLPSSSPTIISNPPRAAASAAQSIVNEKTTIEVISPARSGEGQATAPDSPDTPGDRAHRRRSNVPVSYNVKVLSDIAKGVPVSPVKLSKLREARSPRTSSEAAKAAGDCNVVYTFGRADSVEIGIKQRTVISGFACPFCNHKATSSDGLKIHLNTDHNKFRFHLRRSSPQKLAFFVEFSEQSSRAIMHRGIEQARTLQLNRPVTLFDLEKFLTGNDSWVKARHGALHDSWAEHSDHLHDSSSSGSPHNSRHSSPNTSNDTDEVLEVEVPAPKKSLPTRTRKTVYVPQTSKPLYDTVTKRLLQPGEEIPSSDDEKDEGWLHQKYRDIVLDYKDVTAEEKDYINQWNPSIVAAHLTSESHLPNAVVRFVEDNKIWFAQRRSRKVEFGKHMEMFLMRGVIDQNCIHKCIEILKRGEKLAAATGKLEEIPSPPSPSKQRGVLDCICSVPTEPPDRVICSGKVSCKIKPPNF